MRSHPKPQTGIRLPQSLLEEINAADEALHGANRLKRRRISRKESRKQVRSASKTRKAEYFSASRPQSAQRGIKRVADSTDHTGEPERKKLKVEKPKPVVKTAQNPLPAQLARTQTERDEDAYIAYLESKLGYNKSKTKKSQDDDGLDDLLDFASSLKFGVPDGTLSGGEENSSDSNSEAEQDLSEEWQGIAQSDSSDSEDDSLTQSVDLSLPPTEPPPPTRYVPPHLRQTNSSEGLTKLSKQLKGLLNRMSEQNIATIIESVEDVYRNNRRHDVTDTVTSLIVASIASHSSHLETHVVLYASFVAALYRLIGIDFAAHLVENVVHTYETHSSHLSDPSRDSAAATVTEDQFGKEASNLLVFLTELYNFQVISCVLMFDIIRSILEKIPQEVNVELLLKVVKGTGQQLRTDDPLALKEIIQIVQDKLAGYDKTELSSRTRFMLETLTNLKNNKVAKRNQNQAANELIERMKKYLTGFAKKKHVMAHEPLRVSLSDLHAAELKGKWWLVGAAWTGDPLVDRQQTRTTSGEVDSSLIKLARKQGMNTDIRRGIFVVLMSSDDYVDACERLSQLGLTELQQREIIRVLLHCCGNEKNYNPYYTLVAQHLCGSSHSYKITLQFCLWDFLRDLGESNVGGAEVIKNIGETDFDHKEVSPARRRNLAKAFGWLIAKGSLTIGILKPLDFIVLKSRTNDFLRDLFTQMYLGSQLSAPILSNDTAPPQLQNRNRAAIEDIFLKTLKHQDLAVGLAHILRQLFKGSDGEFIDWANNIALETMRSTVDAA